MIRSSTESRYSRFFLTVTTNEIAGCTTRWSLALQGLTENSDLTTGLDRYAAVSGSVSRGGAGFPQPTTRSIEASAAVSPTTGLQNFNVWYNASHMTLKGRVNVSYTCEVFGADCGFFRGDFAIDNDCGVTPYASPRTTSVEYSGGYKITTTTSFANCGISDFRPAFDPSASVAVQYGDLALDWSKLASIDSVAFVSYYTKTVIMDAPTTAACWREGYYRPTVCVLD
ncbi:hypothetical protein HXX76_004536 [Chlamydomonas incerta]|uniref:Uncharacterized protein n=1 Tax=Chlamydomonas incerta TaxID=51695 RepID=A0A835W6N9_CHLIN|nr:hypothetical protein HXX76_004536 [Chlamydomonas incerta]|eukprot:KAG2439169.1 hypothetical protein HXX76_004536 [Chlamydomonas incerta]